MDLRLMAALAVAGACLFGAPASAQLLSATEAEGLSARCNAGSAPACMSVAPWYAYRARAGDLRRALGLYEKGCALGNALACREAGGLYEANPALRHDPALRNLRKAAELYGRGCEGDAEACARLAGLYQTGQGVARDPGKAAEYRARACRGGLTTACAGGVAPGSARLEALKAKVGAGDGAAAHALGMIYLDGVGVAADPAEAVRWFRTGAGLGDRNAMFYLGVAYAQGAGVAKDPAQGFGWFLKAAERGDATAMFNVAHAYATGVGAPQDDARAVSWFRKAADAGDAEAKAVVANLTYRGLGGLARDPAAAVKLAREAKAAGAANATPVLAAMCADGYQPACQAR